MKIIFQIIILLVSIIQMGAQSTIDKVLTNIATNNKTIKADVQFWEVQKLNYKTGLTLYNPTIDYDYLIGTPANAGNQTDFAINQSFDFPTSYKIKRQLSDEQIVKTEFYKSTKRQDILLDAKLLCIELIYRNKYQLTLNEKKRIHEKWLVIFQTKLNTGDGNVLDVNKAKLQLIDINAAYDENISIINQLNQKLTELNGGNDLIVTDTIYPTLPLIPSFEDLDTDIELNDPIRKYLEQEMVVGQKQLDLSKALSLPKIETGYHYQAILGQKFHGLHVGMTLPLWENKNKVNAQKAYLVLTELNVLEHRNEHYYHIKQKYEKQKNLSNTLQAYEDLFSSLNNIVLLDKSLTMGQITAIEYYMEINYYYNAVQSFLKTEKEYHQTIAELYKHVL